MSIATKCTCHMSSNGYCNSGVKECTQLMSENKSPIGGYAPDTDARSQAPTFDEMVAMIEKLFKDYLKDIRKNVLTDEQIEEGWQRYKTLNHLYQDEQPKPAGAVCDPDFIEFIKNERGEITKEMLSDEWWLTIPPSKRVVIENILIAYDQMAGKLNGSKPAAYER